MLFSQSSMACALGLRLIGATALVAASDWLVSAAALVIVLVGSLLLWTRAGFGRDGSDQMGVVVAFGAFLGSLGLATGNMGVAFAGSLLMAGQLALSLWHGGICEAEIACLAQWRGAHRHHGNL